jgi:hypothetical protein
MLISGSPRSTNDLHAEVGDRYERAEGGEQGGQHVEEPEERKHPGDDGAEERQDEMTALRRVSRASLLLVVSVFSWWEQ